MTVCSEFDNSIPSFHTPTDWRDQIFWQLTGCFLIIHNSRKGRFRKPQVLWSHWYKHFNMKKAENDNTVTCHGQTVWSILWRGHVSDKYSLKMVLSEYGSDILEGSYLLPHRYCSQYRTVHIIRKNQDTHHCTRHIEPVDLRCWIDFATALVRKERTRNFRGFFE